MWTALETARIQRETSQALQRSTERIMRSERSVSDDVEHCAIVRGEIARIRECIARRDGRNGPLSSPARGRGTEGEGDDDLAT
jgi:hypothetical protein